MNLVAYDKVDGIPNNKGTYINVYKRHLYSKEIKYRKYHAFGKKYDSTENRTVFYIIMLDDKPVDRVGIKTILTSNGSVNINLRGIWDELGFDIVKTNYININLKHTEHTDDGDIYLIL